MAPVADLRGAVVDHVHAVEAIAARDADRLAEAIRADILDGMEVIDDTVLRRPTGPETASSPESDPSLHVPG